MYISDSTLVGIWKIDETVEELVAMLNSSPDVETIFQIRSQSRALEKLATLVLLKELAGEQKSISHLPSGRPFLADESYHISISHTKGYAAIILDKEKRVAIDIEQKRDKVYNVRTRLISTNEFIDSENELNHLLLHWSAKECIFKIMNRPELDFLNHIVVGKFHPQYKGNFAIQELVTQSQRIFNASYQVTGDFVLVYI